MDTKQTTKLGAILYSHLDVSDWEEVFKLCGLEQYIYNNDRFLRSLHWDDPDAKSNCFHATEYLAEKNPLEFYEYLSQKPFIIKAMKHEIPEIVSEILDEDIIEPIKMDHIQTPNQIIREAMNDAEILMEKGKSANAFDRIHTSLHGVLKDKCKEQGIIIGENDTVASILSNIRKYISKTAPSDKTTETAKVLASISKIIEILNIIRNKKSLAHPNKTLMGNTEALFLINISKAIMQYVNDIMI